MQVITSHKNVRNTFPLSAEHIDFKPIFRQLCDEPKTANDLTLLPWCLIKTGQISWFDRDWTNT